MSKKEERALTLFLITVIVFLFGMVSFTIANPPTGTSNTQAEAPKPCLHSHTVTTTVWDFYADGIFMPREVKTLVCDK